MVKAARANKGISQAELADRLQISTSYLSRIENGKCGLSLKLAMRITKTLDCTLKDIIPNGF
jgi:transcriptional regulator with XRE-family HTH domain